MTMYLLLDSAQAQSVRGPSPTATYKALNPIGRAGGVFILPAGVLSDDGFAHVHDRLAVLPQKEGADADFPAPLPESEEA